MSNKYQSLFFTPKVGGKQESQDSVPTKKETQTDSWNVLTFIRTSMQSTEGGLLGSAWQLI